ncbi:5-formyltetrahydrofolate cyclo-ligase [Chelatococcus asaccharovorans]|nr:5-formyltetrahydrofolate cyclo-ligase [Chelatococcus asaccharovorans]CAH1685777.1 5-formyltetrahydrofolate cyclo-ligase [Chelatococcus asaccharovorans]
MAPRFSQRVEPLNDRPIAALKSELRAAVLAARKTFASSDGAAASTALAARVIELPVFAQRDAAVGGYWPIRGEVDPRPLLAALDARGVPTGLPVIVEDDLAFHLWRDGDPLLSAGLGTFGPDPAAAPIVRPSILLVPLVAFDRRGHRLGYGRGFYDRVIARLRAGGPLTTIGLAYAMQEVPVVPTEPHDQPLDYIATEHEVLGMRFSA